MKKVLLATILIYIVTFLYGWLYHGVIMAPLYAEQSDIFYKMEEMKWVLSIIVGLVGTFIFSFIYYKFITPKTMKNAIYYGIVLGIGWGLWMGYGQYCYIKISYWTAFGWFFDNIIFFTISGIIWGWLIKEEKA